MEIIMGKASQFLSFKKHSIFSPFFYIGVNICLGMQWDSCVVNRQDGLPILLDGVHVNGISPCMVQCAFFFLSNNAAIRQPPPESTYTVKFHSIRQCDVRLTKMLHTMFRKHTSILHFLLLFWRYIIGIQKRQNFSRHRTPTTCLH